ncbi:hypothetical protein V494_01841, partial [Pseudogymnoascus sp. VKM F-4513 (FW-928)]
MGRKVVDEEARRLALRNGEVVRELVHERDVKIEAERLVDRERERERGRLGAITNGGVGNGLGLAFMGGGNGGGGGGGYQDLPYRQNASGQWGGGNIGGNRGGSFETSPQPLGSNHIHVHTAPLVQGPSISTPALGG